MSRIRSILLALAALAAIAVPGCTSNDPDANRTYLLVHGAWLDHTGWDPVAARLRDAGATVVTVDLPAHGADPAPASAATLASYVDRVSAAIDAANGPVILVGHSMAGVVITQVADRRADDLTAVIYVAAYVPRDGESLLDLAMTDADSQIGPSLIFHPDGTVGIDATAFPALFCADCDAAATAALTGSYQDEPGGPLGEKVALTTGIAGVRTTYVHTTADRAVSPSLQARMVAATPMDCEVSLDTSHVPMLAAPDALAAALLAEPE